jgi:hypothetical protein
MLCSGLAALGETDLVFSCHLEQVLLIIFLNTQQFFSVKLEFYPATVCCINNMVSSFHNIVNQPYKNNAFKIYYSVSRFILKHTSPQPRKGLETLG